MRHTISLRGVIDVNFDRVSYPVVSPNRHVIYPLGLRLARESIVLTFWATYKKLLVRVFCLSSVNESQDPAFPPGSSLSIKQPTNAEEHLYSLRDPGTYHVSWPACNRVRQIQRKERVDRLRNLIIFLFASKHLI